MRGLSERNAKRKEKVNGGKDCVESNDETSPRTPSSDGSEVVECLFEGVGYLKQRDRIDSRLEIDFRDFGAFRSSILRIHKTGS